MKKDFIVISCLGGSFYPPNENKVWKNKGQKEAKVYYDIFEAWTIS